MTGLSAERPRSLDAAGARALVLDRDGTRLRVADPEPRDVPGVFRERAARLLPGDAVAVLGEDARLRTLRLDGAPIGELTVRENARCLAATPGGGILVGYGRAAHGVRLDRFGASPLVHREPALDDARALAVEPGAVWVLGTGPRGPLALALRPVPSGFAPRDEIPLPAPPLAAALGPDGALWVLLEPGAALVRLHRGAAGAPVPLPEHAVDVARLGPRLLVLCASGVRDVTEAVPAP